MTLRSESAQKHMDLRPRITETHVIYHTTIISDPLTPKNYQEAMKSENKKNEK